ncbi:MAG TPA: tagatose-bisphosphate aldolase [Firmicutes bacterium]|nr:tagatose-bisphosphate aldolase [Bacillota bacterium]
MSLISLRELYTEYSPAGAVCGFDFINMEFAKAIIAGAEELKTPVILMVTEGGVKYAGLEYVAALGRVAAENAHVPVVLHLDHCTSFDLIVKAISLGFTSVMIDGSALPFGENLKLTTEVVRVAHAAGVSVEAELGRVGGKEEQIKVKKAEETMTDPDEAVEFVAKTQIDCLAVAIGTSHGLYQGVPELNFALLAKLNSLLNIPLVLHGGSGLPDTTVQEAIRLGIRKFNVWTELAVTQVETMRKILAEQPKLYDPRKILSPSMQAITEVVKKKILLTRIKR